MRTGWTVLAVVAAAVAFAPIEATPQEARDRCASCHRTLDDERLSQPAALFDADVHGKAGVTCTACHGGDALAERETVAHAGMLARPPRTRVPTLCGRCHSNADFMKRYDPDIRLDQVEAYRTSRHGQLLARGDERVAICVDCHTTHAILPPTDELSSTHPRNLPELCGSCHADSTRMRPYGIPTSQLAEYRESVHWEALDEGGDLSSAACNDCHGNHGAVPPGYASVGRVCAECHFQIGQYFALSPHDSAFVALDRPGCATCHGNHRIRPADDALLGLGEEATCRGSGCHSAADEGGRASQEMHALIDSLLAAHAAGDSILLEAEHAGMPVGQALFELAQVQNAIVGARAILHTARVDSVRAKIDEGLTAATGAYQSGLDAFDELRVRRTGLAVSAVVIVVLIGALLIKIRSLGGPPPPVGHTEVEGG